MYFVAAADARSLSAAARQLHVSQATISQQLRRLERQAGGPLFARHARGVTLTDAGAALLGPARQMLESQRSFREAAMMIARGRVASLKVAVLHHGVAELTNPIIRAFKNDYPDVEVVPRSVPLADLEACVLDGRVDVALQYLPVDHPSLRVDALFEEPRTVVISAWHELAGRRRIPLERYLRSRTIVATPRAPVRWARFWGFYDEREIPAAPTPAFDDVAAAMRYLSVTDDAATSMPLSASRFVPTADLRFVRFAEPLTCTAAVITRDADNRQMISDFRAIACQVATDQRTLVPYAEDPRPAV
jgi:DNA-binding transcriptional LysR family regulator